MSVCYSDAINLDNSAPALSVADCIDGPSFAAALVDPEAHLYSGAFFLNGACPAWARSRRVCTAQAHAHYEQPDRQTFHHVHAHENSLFEGALLDYAWFLPGRQQLPVGPQVSLESTVPLCLAMT